MTEKHQFEKFLTLELIAERYDMCTVDNLKHVLLNFRKHVILLCCFAMSPAVLLIHDDKDDVAMRARCNLSPVVAPPLAADALQPEDLHAGCRLPSGADRDTERRLPLRAPAGCYFARGGAMAKAGRLMRSAPKLQT